MYMMTSLLSTLGGALFGGVQNLLEHKQDFTREVTLAKIQSEKEIELAKQGVIISQNQIATQVAATSQEEIKAESSIKSSETEEYKSFADAATQTSALWQSDSILADISNFITTTTRPIVTYILLSLVCIITMTILRADVVPENHLIIFDLILAEFSAVMSYWFVRRSFEKRNSLAANLQANLQKKN